MKNQINSKSNTKRKINVNEWIAKYKSKRENLDFIKYKLDAYIDDYDNVSIYYTKDIISGKVKW